MLEEQGLLAHPHTSAGRVPTDSGYRYFVDHVLPKRTSTAVAPRAVELTLARREVDEAMRMTTETLSQVTNLLAIVTAPPIATTTIRHVEVLAPAAAGADGRDHHLHRRRVEAGVRVRVAGRSRARRVGGRLPQRAARRDGAGRADAARRLEDPSLPATERAFLTQLAPAFTELAETAEDTLYVDGAARLLGEYRFQDLTQLNPLMEMLERRVALLERALRGARRARHLRAHRA